MLSPSYYLRLILGFLSGVVISILHVPVMYKSAKGEMSNMLVIYTVCFDS